MAGGSGSAAGIELDFDNVRSRASTISLQMAGIYTLSVNAGGAAPARYRSGWARCSSGLNSRCPREPVRSTPSDRSSATTDTGVLGGTLAVGSWRPVHYLWFFIAGYLVVSHEKLQSRIVQARWVCLALVVIYVALSLATGGGLTRHADLAVWPGLLSILGLGMRHLTRRTRLLTRANEAVLPFYILHQTVLLSVGFFVVLRTQRQLPADRAHLHLTRGLGRPPYHESGTSRVLQEDRMPFPTTPRSRLLRIGLVTAAALCALSIIATGCASSTTAETTETTASRSLPSQTTIGASSLETSSSSTDAELFDSSVVHEITVSFAQEDYDAMIGTYEASGEKDWIEATVVIDGETYENVGMRLKGNSSIMSLRGGGMGNMGPMGGDRPTQTTETSTTESVEAPAADGAGITSTTQAGAPQRDTWQGFPGAAGGPGGSVSADAPEGLPWLIDLDKSVDGQNHEGVVEFCVRSNGMETALNEVVSLELLEEAGLASQEASAVRFSVNESEAVLRLVIENPDDLWMAANFDISGALYKAESTGDYSYRGDDPDSYDEVFDQEAGKDNADLTPLVEFLDFINNSDDATFNAELSDRLDIDSFATYLALEDLIANSDDINGAGNNSYLYYDTKAGTFTVVAWDHNLAFGTMGGAGRLGGGGAMALPYGAQMPDGFQMPDGAQPPDGFQMPYGAQRPDGFQMPYGARAGGSDATHGRNGHDGQVQHPRGAVQGQSGVGATL